MRAPAARPSARRPGRLALYAAWLAVATVSLHYAIYRLRRPEPSPRLVEEDARAPSLVLPPRARRRLGVLRRPELRRSSFARFPRRKPPGTLRIGCFGDSFTFGDEVDDGHDYPALLDALFARRPGRDVEVLNFGETGAGFQQSFLLYDEVGRHYELDFVVLLPFGFWVGRDLTFAKEWGDPERTVTLHARHVLAGDGLALVEVLGEAQVERFRAYQRFLTPLRYVRYDRRPPAFLRVLLPEGRTLPNPFYYRRGTDPEVEARALYRRFLVWLEADAMATVVLDADGELADLVEPGARHVSAVRAGPEERFPYQAPLGHWSPWGYRLVAEQVHEILGGGAPEAVALDVTPAPWPAGVPVAPLGGFERVAVELGGRRIGSFRSYGGDGPRGRRTERFAEGVESLWAVAGAGQPLVEATFLPLPDLRGDAVEVADGDGFRLLGHLERSSVLARFDVCTALVRVGIAADGAPCGFPPMPDAPPPSGRRLTLRAGGAPVAEGVVGTDGAVVLHAPGRAYRIRADGDVYPDPRALPERGAVALVLSGRGRGRQELALGRYAVRPVRTHVRGRPGGR